MADPLTSLLGKRAFMGTGRTADYFPEAPDLSFLERPVLPSGGGYNPKLDPEYLISAGFSPRNAMALQQVRQQFHAQAESEREYADSQRALDSLSRLDPSGKNFSKELLGIFRSSPRAMRDPEVLQQADFISRFATPQSTWSVEDIEDPDIYAQAVKENWGTLTPQEARRRAAQSLTQRTIRGELAALGMSKADLDKIPAWSQEDYLREKGRLLREVKSTGKEGLSSSELGKFSDALTAYNDAVSGVDAAATDEAKIDAFERARGRAPKSEQDWKDAYAMVQGATVDPPKRALQQLVDLYQGRNIPEVVLRTLGISGAPAAAPQTAPGAVDPWEATKSLPPNMSPAQSPTQTLAPSVQVPTESATVSPADLKRGDLYNAAQPAPVTFDSLSQQMAQKAEQDRKRREAEQQLKSREEQRKIDIEVPRWEAAKTELLQQFRPEYLNFSSNDSEVKMMLDGMGKKWNQKAFEDASGSSITWLEVARSLLADDRIHAMRTGQPAPASTPISTQQQQELPRVNSAQEFAAIPSGGWFMDSSGVAKRKK